MSQFQKGKTNLDFTEATDSEWQWAICKSAPRSRQITMPAPHHSFLQAGCPSCRPTNSVKALKAFNYIYYHLFNVICSLCDIKVLIPSVCESSCHLSVVLAAVSRVINRTIAKTKTLLITVLHCNIYLALKYPEKLSFLL